MNVMKKKLITLGILTMVGWLSLPLAKAPPFTSFYIKEPDHIITIFIPEAPVYNPFESIWQAVCEEESGSDSTSHRTKTNYNPKDPNGGSHGISQIGLRRLKEYNKTTGKNYTKKDLYNVEVSKEIFMFYAHRYGPYKTDLIIRKWNGSGPKSYAYLKRVKKHIRT
jgi:hypothetical protein